MLGFICIGSLATAMGVYFWFYEDRSNADSDDHFRMMGAILVGPLFLLIGIFFSIYIPYQTYQFRSVKIADVSEFVIVTTEDEYSPDGEIKIKFDNKTKIHEMLKSLDECKEFSPNHESFEDGYKVKLVFDDNKYRDDLYISVYKRSSAKNGKTSVMAHIGEENNLNLGNYSCPKFQELIVKNIDPLFNEINNSETKPKVVVRE